jgi:hypothetical protein
MRGLMDSGDIVLHNSTLAFRYFGAPVGEEKFFDLEYCPKCGQRIVVGRHSVTVASVPPVARPPAPVAEAKVKSRDNHVMVVAGLLGVGLFIFVQFAFGMLSDFLGWNIAEAAEQCKVLYTSGNIPMYSCGTP